MDKSQRTIDWYTVIQPALVWRERIAFFLTGEGSDIPGGIDLHDVVFWQSTVGLSREETEAFAKTMKRIKETCDAVLLEHGYSDREADGD